MNKSSRSALPKKRVVSGMRATGRLHLGNYHGALKNWLKLQHEYESFFFVADWHALTTQYEALDHIQENTQELIIDWLASGLDPDCCTIFVQSEVPEQAELHLLLSMITPLGWLERVPTYKDQQAELKEKNLATYGFLGYPVLQSADVLAYQADFVPVGEDQVAHLEITREIARRFNHLYEETLSEPQVLLTQIKKMPGLDGRKMSKSYENTIALRESSESLSRKIRKMPTDPARVRRSDPGEPTKCPVFALQELYASDEQKNWITQGCRSAGIGCLECKQVLIDAIEHEVAPMVERAKAFSEDPKRVQTILKKGCEKARETAQATLIEVRQAMGLRPVGCL